MHAIINERDILYDSNVEKFSYDESAVKHSAAKCKDFRSINDKCTQFEISVLAQSLLTCFLCHQLKVTETISLFNF